jgi:5-methyltetrahydrofolate--homocysteine methyltransferase
MPLISSAFKTVDMRQSPPPLIIGERVNAQGSRKAKRMVLADDYEGLVGLAREQADAGAHCLDVCVATTERDDELDSMVTLVKRLSLEMDTPLVIDSTDPTVVEAAVRQIPGRPVINSINLEGDGSRFSSLAPIMARYGVPAVAMCIGPEGMAKTAAEKLDTARLMVERGQEHGIQEWQYVFDPLTFTLATGQEEFADSAVQTIRGIELIKTEFPRSYTVVGLSNVSFGLDPYPRRIVNSVFLYHAIRAGLDCVIANPRDLIPYPDVPTPLRDAAGDLIFNRNSGALAALLERCAGMDAQAGSGPPKPAVDPSWPAKRRANYRIINQLKEGIERDVVLAIADNMESPAVRDDGRTASIDMDPSRTHEAAIATLNGSLLPAMKTVGDMFGAGELILPFVLKSAECMKAAVSELEKYLVKKEGASKGRLVLGTVYGDVHDIGKNLVKTIFQNNGYTVYDLGKQVPLQKFLEKIEEVDADAVGLSALLVNTSREMKHFVDHAREHGMDIPILCGGAAINSNYINRLATDGGVYEPGMFYCRDMFDGLDTMNRLMADRATLLSEWHNMLEKRRRPSGDTTRGGLPRSSILPVAPPRVTYGTTIVSDIDYDEVWKLVDQKSLFKLGWGVRGRAGREQEEDHQKIYGVMKGVIREMFEPRIIYGYFRCRSRGESLEVEGNSGSVVFDFPRSHRTDHLCISDYFGNDDVVVFQACTAGAVANRIISEWSEAGRIVDAYYLNGLATEFVEALASWTNNMVRRQMGLEQGCLRYSWGYPDCPDVAQHRLVWDLLQPDRIGMKLTTSGQITPDLSTVAIVVHHPDAKYSK